MEGGVGEVRVGPRFLLKKKRTGPAKSVGTPPTLGSLIVSLKKVEPGKDFHP